MQELGPGPGILSSGFGWFNPESASGHVWDEVNREELLQVRLVLGDSALPSANLPEGSQVNWKIKVSLMVPIPPSAWTANKLLGFGVQSWLPPPLAYQNSGHINELESEFSHMQREHDVHVTSCYNTEA